MIIRCPAKINWFLDVGQRRPDGYHELHSVMQRVDLADELRLRLTDEPVVRFACAEGTCACADEDNIVVRAARRLFDAGRPARGVEIVLAKRIPVAAGLGGGSSDAAGVLLALPSLWKINLSVREVAEIARGLGADVPFFLGEPAALCEGVGERVTPLPAQVHPLVLWNPALPLSTAAVYRQFDTQPRPRRHVAAFLAAYERGAAGLLAAEIWNNLAFAAVECLPALAQMTRTCLTQGALACWITGSGPTVVSLCSSAVEAQRLAQALRAASGAHGTVIACGTLA